MKTHTGRDTEESQLDQDAYQPVLMRADTVEGREQRASLLEVHPATREYDTLAKQLRELLETRNPHFKPSSTEMAELVARHLGGASLAEYGNWVYYPWSARLVHVLPEAEYRELRTSRNRNKITAAEQTKLRSLRLGVVGLSVGQATAVTLALEEIGGEYLLADFDRLELSNMNRLRAGVHDIGVNKAVLTAREIFEINPYARVQVFAQGIDSDNIDAFLSGDRKLDLLFEECDDLQMKIRLREKARQYGIPVLMETSDRGLIDVERFDLEPDRPILHGLIGDLAADSLKGLTTYQKVPIVLQIIGEKTLSKRMAASLVDVETTLKTWPQLASNVVLGGALNTDVARRIALGTFTKSGRYYVDLEACINDQVEATPARAPAYEVQQVSEGLRPTLPSLAASETLGDEQVAQLVSYAISAPSGGNCQPWRFEYKDGALDCFLVDERSRTFLDYQNTASYLAIGAALENVRLAGAAMKLGVQQECFPDAAQPDLVWRVRLTPSAAPFLDDSELVRCVGGRTTNRRLGAREPLSVQQTEVLEGTARVAGARLQLLHDAAELDEAGAVIGEGERLRLLNVRMHREMMSEVRWSAPEAETSRDGLDLATLELTPTDLAGMRLVSDWSLLKVVAELDAGQGLARGSRKAIAAASAVGLLTGPGKKPANWVEGGVALQRVWLRATQLGLAFQPMTPLLYLFNRLEAGRHEGFGSKEIDAFSLLRTRFARLFTTRSGEAELMLFRLARTGPPSARSLRRPVGDVLRIQR